MNIGTAVRRIQEEMDGFRANHRKCAAAIFIPSTGPFGKWNVATNDDCLGSGFNRVHAEIKVLMKTFSMGERGSWMVSSSPPCPACAGAIIHAGITHFVYLSDHGFRDDDVWEVEFGLRLLRENHVVVLEVD